MLESLLQTGDECLVFCGVVASAGCGPEGAGAEGAGAEVEDRVRRYAADDRWRVREAAAMALQRLGDADLPRLLGMVIEWVGDDHPLVQRAAAAGICEPRLLRTPEACATALDVCEAATESLAARPAAERRSDGVRALRKGLGYCWSVAVAADPESCLPRFRALEASADPDVAWIVHENRRKKRLAGLL
jgi:hypothetical protein